jgi:hypothetical protein
MQSRSLHFCRPYAAQDLAAPTPPNGGRQLCRLQFAKHVSVTQISYQIQGRSSHFGALIIGGRMSSGTQ